jgi:uncharacterized protein VirK/YbjX
MQDEGYIYIHYLFILRSGLRTFFKEEFSTTMQNTGQIYRRISHFKTPFANYDRFWQVLAGFDRASCTFLR